MFRKVLFACVWLWSVTLVQARELPDFTGLVEKYGAAVVNISSSHVVRNNGAQQMLPGLPNDDPAFDFFRKFMPPQFGGPREFESKSLGSGFIISSDGYILTNAHVVDDADEVTVKLTDKREFKAKVVGSDKRTDVALVKISASGLPRVALGDVGQVRVGEWVVAIGSPFGFESSVTAGIVSAKGRSLPQENYVPFIQTDVAINPGNSGGPLFNMKGEVIGINSQIYSRTGGFMGLSFAIPIDVAIDVSNQLKAHGKVSRGWLGVGIQEVTKELAESFGLPKAAGALIAAVEPGSPAEKAGLEASDVVLKFDGKAISSSSELPRIVGTTRPGSKVVVQVWRKGGTKELVVTVGEAPAEKMAQRSNRPGKTANKLGLVLGDLLPEQKNQLRLRGGVLVQDVSGVAARAGIQRGDVIVAINNSEVKGLEHFNQMLAQFGKGRNIALLVKRGDGSIYVPLKINGE